MKTLMLEEQERAEYNLSEGGRQKKSGRRTHIDRKTSSWRPQASDRWMAERRQADGTYGSY